MSSDVFRVPAFYRDWAQLLSSAAHVGVRQHIHPVTIGLMQSAVVAGGGEVPDAVRREDGTDGGGLSALWPRAHVPGLLLCGCVSWLPMAALPCVPIGITTPPAAVCQLPCRCGMALGFCLRLMICHGAGPHSHPGRISLHGQCCSISSVTATPMR